MSNLTPHHKDEHTRT